jgi:Flp pilus assembly protein TadG
VGLSLTLLLGFGALSVDIGMIRLGTTQLQQTLDAAAISATSALDGTEEGIEEAIEIALEVAAANLVMDRTVTLASSDVVAGVWDADYGTFTAYTSGDDPAIVNAIRVSHAPPALVPGLGALAFGRTGYDIEAKAMSQRRLGAEIARSTQCYLPIAIPDCQLQGLASGTNPGPLTFTFAPSPTDAVAWGDPDANPNSNDLRDQLRGQCDYSMIELDQQIYVNEGNHTTAIKALDEILDVLNNGSVIMPDQWDTSLYGPLPTRPSTSGVTASNWGNVLQGPVPLIDAGTDCGNVSFTGTKRITGIAWAMLFDVQDTTSNKYISVQLDVVNQHDIWGDNTTSGTSASNVRAPSDPELVSW